MRNLIKKFLLTFILVSIVIVIGLIATKQKTVQEELSPFEMEYGEYKPKLWIIENKKNGNRIYLFGSIHIGVKEMYPLPQTVMDAFDSCDVLAVEHDITKVEKDYMLAWELLNYFKYKDGTTIKDHLTKEELETLQEIALKYEVIVDENSSDKPIFYTMLMQELLFEKTKYSQNYGVDRHLLKQAKEKGKQIKDIEDVRYTYNLIGGLSDKTQEYLVYDLIKSLNSSEKEMYEELDVLYKSWVNGTIEEYADEYEELDDDIKEAGYEESYNEYNHVLLDIRNDIMVDKAIKYLNSNDKYFFVVGAMHFEAETGIIKQLENKGYEVKRIIY